MNPLDAILGPADSTTPDSANRSPAMLGSPSAPASAPAVTPAPSAPNRGKSMEERLKALGAKFEDLETNLKSSNSAIDYSKFVIKKKTAGISPTGTPQTPQTPGTNKPLYKSSIFDQDIQRLQAANDPVSSLAPAPVGAAALSPGIYKPIAPLTAPLSINIPSSSCQLPPTPTSAVNEVPTAPDNSRQSGPNVAPEPSQISPLTPLHGILKKPKPPNLEIPKAAPNFDLQKSAPPLGSNLNLTTTPVSAPPADPRLKSKSAEVAPPPSAPPHRPIQAPQPASAPPGTQRKFPAPGAAATKSNLPGAAAKPSTTPTGPWKPRPASLFTRDEKPFGTVKHTGGGSGTKPEPKLGSGSEPKPEIKELKNKYMDELFKGSAPGSASSVKVEKTALPKITKKKPLDGAGGGASSALKPQNAASGATKTAPAPKVRERSPESKRSPDPKRSSSSKFDEKKHRPKSSTSGAVGTGASTGASSAAALQKARPPKGPEGSHKSHGASDSESGSSTDSESDLERRANKGLAKEWIEALRAAEEAEPAGLSMYDRVKQRSAAPTKAGSGSTEGAEPTKKEDKFSKFKKEIQKRKEKQV